MTPLNGQELHQRLSEVCTAFRLPGIFSRYETIKNGNVNDTYRVICKNTDELGRPDGTEKSYVAQRINTYAFRTPEHIMANIDAVTEWIRERYPERRNLHFHHTEDRKNFWYDEDQNFWRLFNYVESNTFNASDDMRIIQNAGKAFGDFQASLSGFPVGELYETIPNFHNTRERYRTLIEDVGRDEAGRVNEVREELEWLLGVEERACLLTDLLKAGSLPLRVTHNDTKINNVLFDKTSGAALVVIDLDTVMPGVMGHDFGDAIRFAANTEAEDSPNAERVELNMEVFRAFAEGFLPSVKDSLTETELETLADSPFCIAAELATRFLDDYLNGDKYFHIGYPTHNLVRTRCQIALAKTMLRRRDEMREIIFSICR